MNIYTVDSGLPTTTKISLINNQVLQISGQVEASAFDKYELDALYTNLGISRQYLRNQGIGSLLSTYTGWTCLITQTGYSIWKYTPPNYSYNINNNLYFNGAALLQMGNASSESTTTFSSVMLSNISGFTYDTTEAGIPNGVAFPAMATTSDYLYIGSGSTFAGLSIVFSTRGSGYTNVVQYWNGSTWVTLLNTTHYLVDNTNSFAGSGTITWNVSKISDWATTAVNANTLYWIRISTTTTPVTVAQVNYLIPNSNVIGLLALSSSDVIASNWKWCSYGSNIYATIPNTGNAYYEGNSYITSLSTTTNLQNFFIYNNSFTADYQDSTYVSSVATVIRSATKYILSFTDSSIASGNILVITHNIGQKFVHVQIYDNNGNKVEPDLIQLINSNVCYVTMGSFRTLSGTWTAVVM